MELMVQRAQEAAMATGNRKIVENLPTIPPEFNPFWAPDKIITVPHGTFDTKGSPKKEP